eukprot:CAMPEP_0185744082 /NCGR_PEP_ID=MMETSP1174-20130828/2102_1 /TAXON_ID=35687 /ORGANISM="Dictyocha speculum, Strain CCMP1381" /LENGTH=137 /DNA_ID=CAMNT_0028417259 /DNA_START=68 /DNA_END=482 /DNA_ORIENTATION=-
MTFHVQYYADELGGEDDDDDNPGEVTREIVVVEGNGSRNAVDETGWVAARRFALRLTIAAGKASTHTPLDSLRAESWMQLLGSLGLPLQAAQLLAMVYFPWCEGGKVKQLNDPVSGGGTSPSFRPIQALGSPGNGRP